MLDAYTFGLAEADAIALTELAADCPGLAAQVTSYVTFDQPEEIAHAAF